MEHGEGCLALSSWLIAHREKAKGMEHGAKGMEPGVGGLALRLLLLALGS